MYLPSHQVLARYRDCHIVILKALQDQRSYGPLWTNKQVTQCLINHRDEYKYNHEAVELLIRSHLVNMQQYDQHLAQVCCVTSHLFFLSFRQYYFYFKNLLLELLLDLYQIKVFTCIFRYFIFFKTIFTLHMMTVKFWFTHNKLSHIVGNGKRAQLRRCSVRNAVMPIVPYRREAKLSHQRLRFAKHTGCIEQDQHHVPWSCTWRVSFLNCSWVPCHIMSWLMIINKHILSI